jgi:hypothetical protein
MSNVHILPDENLGGVLREYVEVNRKAKAGDKIVIVCPDEGSAYEKGDIFTVEKSFENYPEYEDGVRIAEDYYFIYHSEYHTLEPTDIVRIKETYEHGKWDYIRCRLVDRKAKVGEKVIVIENFAFGKIGEIHTIKEVREHHRDYTTDKAPIMNFGRCLVLEPVEPAETDGDVLTVDETEASKSVIDLLANLAHRLTTLEQQVARRVTELERKFENLESRQKRLMGRIADTEEKLEMILDDIVTLDERTQPLVKPFGEESPFATVATIPTFKFSELIGKTLKIYGGRDGEYATVFGYDESTGKSYVLFNGKEADN